MNISRAIVAVWLVAWMLFASLLSANPSLHEQIHDNASQSSHQCAVTLLEQQQLLSGEPQVFAFRPDFAETEVLAPATIAFVSQNDLRLLPTRGPPVLS